MRPQNFRFFLVGMCLLLLFVFLLFLEAKQIFRSLDPGITVSLQSLIPVALNVPLSLFTLIGSSEFTTPVLLLLAFLIYKKEKRILYSLGLFAVIFIFEFIGKKLLFHPNPPPQFFRYSLPFHLPTDYVRTNYSFPSGHIARTIFLVVVAGFLTTKLLKDKNKKFLLFTFYFLLSLVMLISRVYLGAHWASDTLGGLLLGGSLGFLALVYY